MRFAPLAVALAFSLTAAASAAQPTVVTPDKIHWTAGTGDMAGTQMAVITGNPAKPGPFTIRIRMPDGYVFQPHWHSKTESVTVLQGTFLVGVGDTVDKSKMTALPTGSWGTMPKATHHYAMAKGVTVVQIEGTGPFDMHMAHAGAMH